MKMNTHVINPRIITMKAGIIAIIEHLIIMRNPMDATINEVENDIKSMTYWKYVVSFVLPIRSQYRTVDSAPMTTEETIRPYTRPIKIS